MVTSTRTGRRPGPGTARDDILNTARELFARDGFRGTTMRAVAEGAGVDPALVTHYFGSKQGLFDAVLELPFDPRTVFQTLVAAGTEELGERLVRFFLSTWTSDGTAGPLATLVRTVINEPTAARTLERLLVQDGLGPALASAGLDEPELRAAMIASQLVGMGLLRFVLRIEPLASCSDDLAVANFGPAIQRFVTAPLAAQGGME